jgi:hypothetical protein
VAGVALEALGIDRPIYPCSEHQPLRWRRLCAFETSKSTLAVHGLHDPEARSKK